MPTYSYAGSNPPIYPQDGRASFVDVNGDGLTDIYRTMQLSGDYNPNDLSGGVWINKGNSFSNLAAIKSSESGLTNITYSIAAIQDISNKTPSNLRVVDSVSTNDSNGLTATTTYKYKDARYYFTSPTDRRLAGFGEITKTNPDGSKVTTKYHQANGQIGNEPVDSYAKIGKPYEENTTDASNNLFLRTRLNYVDTANGNNSTSSLLTSQLIQQYDGTSNRTDTAVTYSYDAYGNPTVETKLGIVTGNADGTFTDIGTDKHTLESNYTNDTTRYIVALPVSKSLRNNLGTEEARTNYRYDIKGNQLAEGKWINGTNFATTTTIYNNLGLITSEINALGATTTYTYDTNNLFPATVTNSLSQNTLYTYDYSSGKAKRITDPNGKIIEYIYDGLDRLIAENQTLGNGATSTVRTRTYNTTVTPQYVSELLYQNATTSREIRTYLDGFGREIQKKLQFSSGWTTLDTIYDGMGRIQKVSIPYNTTSNAKSTATTVSSLLTTNTFDPLGRILTTTDARGVTTMLYSGLITTVTDALTRKKEYINDAFGNLSTVKEYNGASIYTTAYGYNSFNLLTSVIDAENNTRTIIYDGLGRRTALQDLHTASDTTFGTWIFAYNKRDLTTAIDPVGASTTYTYDSLGRTLTEDSNATAGTDILYAYDNCTNGIGYLCTATSSGAVSKFTYYKQGIQNTKNITIDGVLYPITTTYNRQNQPVTVMFPNSTVVSYGYNIEGLPTSVLNNGMLVASSTYGVHGRPTQINQNNGIVTNLTYNASRLYELTRKLAQQGTSTKLQDLNYVYDAIGNISSVTDSSNTNTAKTQTFTYDDLYRLISTTATGTSNNQNYTQAFAYSLIGNILNFNGVAMTYVDTGFSNPHAVTNVGGQAYGYSNNGNLTSDGVWTHGWDYRNRLTNSTKGTTTTSYTYNQDNARTKLVEGSDTTLYPTDNYEIKNGIPKVYLSLGDITVATAEGTATPALTYIFTDHLGGTTLTTNSTGIITQILDYYPYGATRIDSNLSTTATTSTLYTDSITAPWADQSWNTTKVATTSPVFTGTNSLKVQYNTAWSGISYTRSLNTTPYNTLNFAVNIGISTSTELYLYFTNASGTLIQTRIVSTYIPGGYQPNIWHQVSIPLSDLGIQTYNNTLAFNIESSLPSTVYFDQIEFRGTQTGTLSSKETDQYTGYKKDYSTNLNYAGARYYNSINGRFISQDPVAQSLGNQSLLENKTRVKFNNYLRNPQTHNSYSYAGNNPIVNKDSSGQYVETAFDAVMFANSANSYRQDPSFVNRVGLALDSASLALPVVPAIGGTIVRQTANVFAGYSPQLLGKAGELASGVVTGFKEVFKVGDRTRIPDAVSRQFGYVAEVKNVRYQGLTLQLKDSLQIAQQNGLQFRLYVRESTQLSKPLQQAVDNGSVQLNRMSDKSIESAINKSSKEK